MTLPKRKVVFQPSIFVRYVSFREGSTSVCICPLRTPTLLLVGSTKQALCKTHVPFASHPAFWLGALPPSFQNLLSITSEHFVSLSLAIYPTCCCGFLFLRWFPTTTFAFSNFKPHLYHVHTCLAS